MFSICGGLKVLVRWFVMDHWCVNHWLLVHESWCIINAKLWRIIRWIMMNQKAWNISYWQFMMHHRKMNNNPPLLQESQCIIDAWTLCKICGQNIAHWWMNHHVFSVIYNPQQPQNPQEPFNLRKTTEIFHKPKIYHNRNMMLPEPLRTNVLRTTTILTSQWTKHPSTPLVYDESFHHNFISSPHWQQTRMKGWGYI